MTVYHSPAKINLSLDVLGLRSDGYHELQSVVHCIGLFDTVRFEFLRDEEPMLQLRCNDARLETDDNLCLRAVREFLKHSEDQTGMPSRDWRGVRITLDKTIPAGAGLGGGSGNAAATLLALLHRYERALDENSLRHVAAKLGADVPLFLRGGCILIEGIGEKLKTLVSLKGWVVLIHPPQHASTPAVYRRFDDLNAPSQKSTPRLLEAMRARDLPAVASALGNDLALAAQSLDIDVALPISLLKKHGALGASLTGSGAASFGLFADEKSARSAAREIEADAMRPNDYRVFTAPLIPHGVIKVKN